MMLHLDCSDEHTHLLDLGCNGHLVLGRVGSVPKPGKEAEELPQQGIVREGQGEIVCAQEYCYIHWIYLMIFCTGYPIKRAAFVCDAHYFIIAT